MKSHLKANMSHSGTAVSALSKQRGQCCLVPPCHPPPPPSVAFCHHHFHGVAHFLPIIIFGWQGRRSTRWFPSSSVMLQAPTFWAGLLSPWFIDHQAYGDPKRSRGSQAPFQCKECQNSVLQNSQKSQFLSRRDLCGLCPQSPTCIYIQAQVTPKYTSAVLLGTVSA